MPPLLLAVASGFGTGLSLIVVIGAQNAFVLRQGIRRESVPLVVTICAASDAILIALGVAGVGSLVRARPTALTVVGIVGGLFLICYGLLAARRLFRPAALTTVGTAVSGRRAALTCLTMTWLNPNVYLDTVLLLGSVAATHGSLRWEFGLGAALASLCWFVAIGFGARLLTGFFSRPSSWRLLDGLVAATMLTVGGTLLATA
ncbi:L-lysine exporter family protein LysE/ArgO [Amycolatopsis bartoniae]|uniref:Amino acid transporter n=1 Tax=Amycolatopsis bartoniae TaxID=941986 RepID=A0A8H9MDC5_9PSEU|nr:LysE/ArgO family amino acid transporter [Amycolatopsis bartoniae]MBB2936438.1 L-lysine exporter family protein LysE/ArgO [Amycolatopsis bartoniae]TVT11075.1 amino acid transporter [Amycolatopsis bartoniae]GHF68953.1 amino acid transporter [Amycolatopsis bartoniae]